MANPSKNQKSILEKLGIAQLNEMQEKTIATIRSSDEVVLLSPTGTGKTLAFLLPVVELLDEACKEVQALIVVPTRELAIQIEQVARTMGSGFKTNAVYGGRVGSQDKIDLKHRPAILVGTPGRIADHLRKGSFPVDDIKALVLDEFDKSLEIGFEKEMTEILKAIPQVQKKILTSASQGVKIPVFVGLKNQLVLNYLAAVESQLKIKAISASNKLETLVAALCHIGDHPGIVFCNFKDTIAEVSEHLSDKNIDHGCFYGGMEQRDREQALIKFRNGTYRLLLATDLAARGIDVPEIRFIIHFQLPNKEHEFVHRNGRTARMKRDGTAYILKEKNNDIPDYIDDVEVEKLKEGGWPTPSKWRTLYIGGGRRDKISKGDIAGLLMKQGKLTKDELSVIEIQQDCAYVGVLGSKISNVIKLVNNTKLKTKKVRVSEI